MYSDEYLKDLEEKAYEYIAECIDHVKEQATASGKVIEVKDRHIPTIQYFLRIWLPMFKDKTIDRSTWYQWLNDGGDKSDTIKRIDETFKTLATDIVANEGKGIFYAKNKLGMTDRIESKNDTTIHGVNVTLNLD